MKAVQLFSTKIGIESLPMLVRHNLLTGANTLINRRSGEILNFSAYTIDQFTITNDGRYASIIDDSDPTDSTRIMMQTIGSDSYQAIDIPPTGYIQRGGSSMRMTPNGQFVGYHSILRGPGIPETGNTTVALMRDLVAPQGEIVGYNESGQIIESFYTSVSNDGRYAAFINFNTHRLYLRDRRARTTRLITNQLFDGGSWHLRPFISASGRYLTYQITDGSRVSTIIHDLTNGRLGRLERLTLDGSAPYDLLDQSDIIGISEDETTVFFTSASPAWVPNDTNGHYDVFTAPLEKVFERSM